ncbi:CorA family divalent cation transporter [Moheibacter sediminis]|uniref:Magnesium transporter n=1 Tax=Moheibacter sediminis TaxID=1434700 RepID=A0A1W1YMY9_9FLAO|nr:CorA family divalent cation transporter [Moheibacter sediminis]SMC37486.1 magnesium transporter [Moheibacter sediminis]
MENIFFKNNCFTWYNLENPDETTVSEYLKRFSLSTFTVQDALEAGHLPKFEHQEDFDFILIRFYGKEARSYTNIIREFSHKIGIFIGNDFVITIGQRPIPFLEEIQDEIENDKNRENLLPKQLFYKIFKKTLNTYYQPAVKISQEIDVYENALFTRQNSKLDLKKLYKLKRESATCSKLLVLMRDVLTEYRAYVKSVSSIKDLQEFNAKLLHLHSQNNDDLHNLFNLTLSMSDLRANEVMKILTIFSAFFLPLTFIAGIYGMNFDFMPELGYKWGYFITLGVMLVIVIVIFSWFKRKKFL